MSPHSPHPLHGYSFDGWRIEASEYEGSHGRQIEWLDAVNDRTGDKHILQWAGEGWTADHFDAFVRAGFPVRIVRNRFSPEGCRMPWLADEVALLAERRVAA